MLEIVRANAGNESVESNVEGTDEHYQDFDNANSPTDDSEEDDLNDGKKGEKIKRNVLDTLDLLLMKLIYMLA